MVYRRSMLVENKLAYRHDYFPAEDYKMWIDVLKCSKIYNIPKPLVEYRQHSGQICREKKQEQIELEKKLHEEQLRLIYPNPTDKELRFHLERFVTLRPNSDEEVILFKDWIKRLCEINKTVQYIEPNILQNELNHYVQNAIRFYYSSTYRGVFHHLLSGRCLNLDLRHNLSVIKNGYKA